jgi:hypothetical protein
VCARVPGTLPVVRLNRPLPYIEANPRVRVKVASWPRTRWRAGTARILDDDDPRERQRSIGRGNLARWLCVCASAAMDTSPLTVRIDLDKS